MRFLSCSPFLFLTTETLPKFLQLLDPAVMPLGIITLEDVLEGTCTTVPCF